MKCKPLILKSIKKNKNKLGFKQIKSIKVSKLGVGENNLSMLAIVNKKKITFRIGMRKKCQKNVKREFDFLKKLPKGYGPKPIFYDGSKKIIPHNYSVLTYVKGKQVKRWTKKHLRIHAKALAKLHKHKSNKCGLYSKDKKISLYKELLEEINDFKSVLNDKTAKKALPIIKKYIKDKDQYFTCMKRFSLIHYDPCVDNILFHKGKVRYIDWEYMGYGDNARDVSLLFYYGYRCMPWFINLEGKRFEYYLNTYLKYNPDKTLRQRVFAWQVFHMLTDYLYILWKIKNYHKEKTGFDKKRYKKILKLMRKRLEKRIN